MRAPLLFAVLAMIGCKHVESTVESMEATAQAAPNSTPVLVELFTSEGCSSCPPADAVLARLERTQPVNGANVIPLAFHVDYWDGLGWKDPFSAPAWTSRQRSYAGNYTPQAVIDGNKETTGSREGAVQKFIEEAAKQPHATVAITLSEKEASIAVGALPSQNESELVVAIVQKSAQIAVPRGENSGRTLDHTAIVKKLDVVGKVAAAGATLKTNIERKKDQRLVAFVQEKSSHKVLGTAVVDL